MSAAAMVRARITSGATSLMCGLLEISISGCSHVYGDGSPTCVSMMCAALSGGAGRTYCASLPKPPGSMSSAGVIVSAASFGKPYVASSVKHTALCRL